MIGRPIASDFPAGYAISRYDSFTDNTKIFILALTNVAAMEVSNSFAVVCRDVFIVHCIDNVGIRQRLMSEEKQVCFTTMLCYTTPVL